MHKKLITLISIGIVVLTVTAVSISAHNNPDEGKANHEVGLNTESCQGALAGTAGQLADRGEVNPRLLANVEDKCGFTECQVIPGTAAIPPQLFCESVFCGLTFDAAHEPTLICEEIPNNLGEDCFEQGGQIVCL